MAVRYLGWVKSLAAGATEMSTQHACLLVGLAEFAEIFGDRVGESGRHLVGGAALHLPPALLFHLAAQFHFQRLEIGKNLATQALLKLRRGDFTDRKFLQ